MAYRWSEKQVIDIYLWVICVCVIYMSSWLLYLLYSKYQLLLLCFSRIHIWDPNRVFYFSVFLWPPHSSKRTMARKHWLGKYCIIIITISLRKVACHLNIQHHNYNFHKECRTVIINKTIITCSIRENRLLGEQGGSRSKSLCSNQHSRVGRSWE